MMGEIFASPSRPFYQSTAIMNLLPIDESVYTDFIQRHFEKNGKRIEQETIHTIYNRFEGVTWYIQFVANSLYAMTLPGETCTADKVNMAIANILKTAEFHLLFSPISTSPKTKRSVDGYL